MEPQIQYSTTTDGVSIAYWMMGEGEPLVEIAPLPWSNIEREWHWEYHRLLSRQRKLVRYDARGTGLSDRSVDGFSLDACVADVEAVVDTLSLERFNLWGEVTSSPTAIKYAVRHPERVAHLVLYSPLARLADYYALPGVKSMQSLLDHDDWDAYTSAQALEQFSWDQPSAARDMAAFFHSCIDVGPAKRMTAELQTFDVTDLLPSVVTPTLVIYPRGAKIPPFELSRQCAARIPAARVVVVDSAGAWTDESTDSTLRLLDEFLADGDAAASPATTPARAGLRTVLFTDIVGHTEMMQRLGDARGRDVLREHERITRDTLNQHGGAEIKTMGDGFMASFGSVTSAVECAIALQRAFASHTESMPEPLHVRVGLNAGEPIEEDGDLFGSTVILASRIAAKAGGGEILIPEPVRHLLSGKSFVFSDRGEFVMKGFDDAVRLYEVRWR